MKLHHKSILPDNAMMPSSHIVIEFFEDARLLTVVSRANEWNAVFVGATSGRMREYHLLCTTVGEQVDISPNHRYIVSVPTPRDVYHFFEET